jgi:CRISPR system Cascade subunit CasD
MPRHLVLILEGPLAAFGAEMVDARGPVWDWPGASLLTGLLANALGLTRGQREAHTRLQQRLDFAVRIDRVGTRLRDFQTVQLGQADQGWTTRGTPEGRTGGLGTYESPHIREREYVADSLLTVAVALRTPAEPPTIDDLATALAEPVRPLFLGRKPCLPSRPIFAGFVEGDEPLAAVRLAARPDGWDSPDPYLVTPERPGLPAAWERLFITDERNWISGVHAGERVFRRGLASRLSVDEHGSS